VNDSSRRYWLAVIGNVDRVRNTEKWLWWCFPEVAQIGEDVLMYCPRSVNETNQGIFAHCQLESNPKDITSKHSLCRGYGYGFVKNALRYATLTLVSKYWAPLTAKEMKRDTVLRAAPFVRRNFQGTVFELDKQIFDTIVRKIERKEAQ
jgi:hypothetical protein